MESNLVWNWHGINADFIFRFCVNFVSVFILVRLIYFKSNKRTDLFFTFFSFNLIIFFISFLLRDTGLSSGAGFGLFAIFSLLRYRTEGISARDMTYLFLSISIGLIASVASEIYSLMPLASAMILVFTWLFESGIIYRREYSKVLLYDNIALIKTADHQKLVDDLRERTGLNINRIEIQEIDFLRDACTITIYFYES
jgi:hypothetical protein